MGHMGWLHHQGLGVPVNAHEARRWYERGAAGGDPYSMASLGYFLENGLGGRLDRDEACLWFKQAAEFGNASGKDGVRALACR
jgi:TPR repeat protein